MTWISEHPLLSTLVLFGAAVLAGLVVFFVRLRRERTPEVVEQVHARMVGDRDDMASVPDDRPLHEDEPPTAYTHWPAADQELIHQVHMERLDESGWEPAAPDYWVDGDYRPGEVATVEPAPLRTATSQLRALTGYGHTDHEVHEGEIVTGWYPPVRHAPALPMETTVKPWIGKAVEAKYGDPDEGHTGLTGAFRWGADGRLVPVAQLVAELDAEREWPS